MGYNLIMKYILTLILVIWSSGSACAYVDGHPPYNFKDGPPKHLQAQALVGEGKSESKSKDGRVYARLTEEKLYEIDFILKDGDLVLAQMSPKIRDPDSAFPYSVYRADLNKDGLDDLIVFSNYRGCGLGALADKTEIFLKKKEGGYHKIYFDSLSAGLQDYVDLDKDGRYEVIITDICFVNNHSYYYYNVYEFKENKLVNTGKKFKGFPKFVWFTYKHNDRDTVHLSEGERLEQVKKRDSGIFYAELNL